MLGVKRNWGQMKTKKEMIREVLEEMRLENYPQFTDKRSHDKEILIEALSLMWDKFHAKPKDLPELRKEGIKMVHKFKEMKLNDSDFHDALFVHWMDYFKCHKEVKLWK